MTIIYMLLIISLFVAIIFLVLFVYSVKQGQFDDTYTPAVRMLFEDELVKEDAQPKSETIKTSTSNGKKEITNPDK